MEQMFHTRDSDSMFSTYILTLLIYRFHFPKMMGKCLGFLLSKKLPFLAIILIIYNQIFQQ